jgi:hypothetical protein
MGTGQVPQVRQKVPGRRRYVSIAFSGPGPGLLVDRVKTVVGFARLFRPRYAEANLGAPVLSLLVLL